MRDEEPRPRRRAPAAAPDLEKSFNDIVDDLRADVRRLRTHIDRFARGYQKASDPGNTTRPADEVTQTAFRRLKQLQLVADHIESGAAYLLGSGLQLSDTDEEVSAAQRALESLEVERERLYRDVHDGPAQALANAIFELEYLDRLADRPGEARSLRSDIAGLKERLTASLEGVRAMILDLRPPVLSDLGLARALRLYASEFEARHGMRVECTVDTTAPGIGDAEEVAIYRILQEALQNVHKHARAASVRVTWEHAPKGWTLTCTDDGAGFDLVKATSRRRSVGLMSMRERAELIGGRLEVRSAPEQGTTVALILPTKMEGDAGR